MWRKVRIHPKDTYLSSKLAFFPVATIIIIIIEQANAGCDE